MIFRELFEPISSTYTYLLGCEDTGQAVLVDPVLPAWQRDLEELRRLGLTLAYTLDTHIHADHITAARKLREEVGSRIAHPAIDGLPCADLGVEEGVALQVGSVRSSRSTPPATPTATTPIASRTACSPATRC